MPFQFTRPCGARRDLSVGLWMMDKVSIHAPLRGATLTVNYLTTSLTVSIHAPLRGATGNRMETFYQGGVSIHAPLRGATIFAMNAWIGLVFQFTRPCGARHGTLRLFGQREEFQFTRPCGARPSRLLASIFLLCFNSRALAGRDAHRTHFRRHRTGFNSRALAGRDKLSPAFLRPLSVSIHAPLRGATGSINSVDFTLCF